jgi:hypothetical protein
METGEEVEKPEEFNQFLKLPNDLIRLLIINYFDSISALRCLTVCKTFNNILSEENKDSIRVKVVKLIASEEQQVYIDNSHIQCEICGRGMQKSSMDKHMRKHERSIRGGMLQLRFLNVWPPPDKCKLCDALHPYCGAHSKKGCPLELTQCENYKYVAHHPWCEIICDYNKTTYRKQIRQHNCKFRCKSCNTLFELNLTSSMLNDPLGFYDHLKQCKFKMEIVTLWGINRSFVQ